MEEEFANIDETKDAEYMAAGFGKDGGDDFSNLAPFDTKSGVDIKVNPPAEAYESDPSDIYEQSYISDEDTSSLAGSFDEYGISEKDEDSCQSDQPVGGMKREEKLRRHAIRRHLDQLGELVIEREYMVEKTREQLLKCQQHIEELEKCLEEVQEQTEEEDNKGNRAAYFRLKSQYEKLCTELQIEKDVERNTTKMLEDAEFALCQAYIEHGKFLPLEEELVNDDKAIEKQKAEKSAARLRKENAAVLNAERKRRTRERENLANMRERERKHRHALVAAKKNRELAMKYLKETMSKVRQRESEEEEKNRVELQQRMQALLSLKNNIEGNRENIQALQARDAAAKNRDIMEEDIERNVLISEGLNPDEVLTRRKRLRQFEREKEAFERKQREREIEIVDKILSEEKQVKRRQQQQPQLWPDRQRDRAKRLTRRKPKQKFARSSGSESMEYSADVEDTGGRVHSYNRLGSRLSKVSSDDDDFSPYGATSRDEAKTGESEEEVIVAPEFKGLWEADQTQTNEEETANWRGDKHEYSAYEQKMIIEALEKQRENIVQRQVAAGREFQGAAFYSKPDILEFKDFDVGKVYKKKVLLTNVSYAQNFCKFIEISDNFKDFLEIKFDPPGPMSAGLTCDFLAVFTPMINEDIFGEIKFLAQTGPFSVQVRCLRKRCELSVDLQEVNFESQVIGETRRKTITLKNNGALSTEFQFLDVKGEQPDTAVPLNIDGIEELDGKEGADDEETTPPEKVDNDIQNPITAGQFSKGVIAPFSSVKLEINFSPSVPGNFRSQFKITFTDDESNDIFIDVCGNGIDVPVWVEREVVDMKICMFDRLYQDAIIIHNRATSALRLTFQIPKGLRDYIDILPKTAYIQAESDFSAQLKFLPRTTLVSDDFSSSNTSYHNKETGLLEARILIRVADQTRPVPFTFKAFVTSSDFLFDTDHVDFGFCTIFESVRKTINLRNKSVLSQAYGFISAPETIDVQPNDGFGTLLPEESIPIDIIFSPKKAKEYKFELICKSGIGREFKISCKAVGVLPPLNLSQSVVKFKTTAINDIARARIFIKNSHTDPNEFTHPVPRIGSGPVFPVGPTSFQFCVPDNLPISISPSVGTVKPGEQMMILVMFSPRLGELEIKQEAIRMHRRQEELETANSIDTYLPQEMKESAKGRTKGRKMEQKSSKRSGTPLHRAISSTPGSKSSCRLLRVGDITVGSDEYEAAQLSLLKSFKDSFQRYRIPCYMAYGEKKNDTPLEFSKYYTLFLELHCPCVKPSVVVISDKGSPVVDFGNVATGKKASKIISVQNISNQVINLSSTVLNPVGPFSLVNALRDLPPDAIHNLKLAFAPERSEEYYEVYKVGCELSMAIVKLKGVGVTPSITLSAENGVLDVGDALVGDTIFATLKIKNSSNLSLDIAMMLGSLLPSKHGRTQQFPRDRTSRSGEKSLTSQEFVIGCSNLNGVIPFDCQPIKSIIKPGDVQEFSISFTPDHPSENFADELCINISRNEESHRVRLLARAWPNMTYVCGWDRLKPLVESHIATLQVEDIELQDSKSIQETELLTFKSNLIENEYSECTRCIEIGCIKSNTQTKKSCDFSFENVKEANDFGFSFDPLKGGVDIGLKKSIIFRWKPLNDHDPNIPVHTSVTLVAKGDVTLVYKIMLRGYIVTP